MAEVILDYCLAYNQGLGEVSENCEAFRLGEEIRFPLNDSGLPSAMIHPNIQDKDYQPVTKGDAIFRCFDGSDIVWQGESTIYPHFINEAAYHKLHVAFATASRFTL